MIEAASEVFENRELLSGYFRLHLRLDGRIEPAPGQFAMVRPHGEGEPLLRRALVFYRAIQSRDATQVEFIYRVTGRGTFKLSCLRAGDRVDFLGPLGRGFTWHGEIQAGEALLVSGGIGIPAFLMWAEQLVARKIQVRLFHGSRTVDCEKGMICIDDFSGVIGTENVVCATEDGSFGVTGLVTSALQAYLRNSSRPRQRIFACGPHAMMRGVARLAVEHRIPAQVCLEAPMACGFGVCVACVVKAKCGESPRYEYRRICIDGPVFDAQQVWWQ